MGDNKFLDGTGLQYLWSKIKANFLGKTAKAESAKTADSATKATQDGNGANIANTYATKTEVAGKANASHTHTSTQVVEPSYINGAPSGIMQAKIDYTRPDKLIFLPANQIIIEKTTDGGTTWVDAGYTDAQKAKLFDGTRSQNVSIPLLNGVKSLLCGLRITITAMKYNVPEGTAETAKYGYWNSTNIKSTERYCNLNALYFWNNANSDTIGIKIEAATGADSNNWRVLFNDTNCLMTGWSGSNFIKLSDTLFGGGTNQTTQYWNYRITFMTKGTTASKGATLSTTYTNQTQTINQISGYGTNCWNTPNNLMKFDHLYGWDYLQNATFPAQVTATQFNGSLNGNATNVTGIVAVANGGTGKNNSKDAANVFLNSLDTGGSTPVDGDYYISQYVNGGNTTTTYHRRPMSALLAYVKDKLSTVATSGSYNDLLNKPTIPSEVTETTVTNWGFTKNTGTYSKPSGGIPKTDLASAVQTSLGKADTALQSYTETDPIFVASAAHGITSADITNWNGKTSNTGTITGIKMNGASKGTSGVVDLGTVITSHQSLDAYATKAAYNRKVLTDVSINAPESNFSTYLAATSAGLTALNNFANTVKTNKQSDKKYFNGTSIIDDRANSSITVELEYDSDNDKFLYLKVELDSNSEQHYFGYIPLEVATNKEVTILSSDTYAKATIKYTLTSAGVLTFSKYEMYSTPVYHPTLTFNYSNTDGTSVGTKDIELDNIQVNTVHADSADMAFKDGSGNSIENTYLNKYGDTMRGILSFSLGEGNKARIRQLYNNNILELQGGNQQGFGGFLQLFGKNYTNTNLAGSFRISASNGGDVTPVLGSTQSYLDGKPNGTLSWNDKAIIPVEESGTNYIRYTNGIQICWGRLDSIKSNVSNQTYGKAFNNIPAFTFTSSRNPNTYPLYASWTTSTFNISGTWNSNGHTIGWIAIGTWK